MLKRFATLGLAAAAMIFGTGAVTNWNNQVVLTNGGHLIGNPQAKVALIEWVSYTCPHCAHFAVDGDGALAIAYVGPGKMSREIRHIIRDPIDLTAAMLTNCGAVSKFAQNHAAFMHGQAKWIAPLGSASTVQRQRWTTGNFAARRRAIASDFGFYDIMERRGYRRTDVDRCLADDAKAKSLADMSEADSVKYGVNSTPSFAINGIVLAGTHDWSMLEPQLNARFTPN